MENKTVVGSIGIKRIGMINAPRLLNCQCATFLVLVSSHSERTGKEKSQCFRLRLETIDSHAG